MITELTNDIKMDEVLPQGDPSLQGYSAQKYIPSPTGGLTGSTQRTGSSQFGGNGADGALIVGSGTSTIDLGSASVVIKNYTALRINGSGALTFSNPATNGTLVIFKVQGDVELTSSAARLIDLRGIGAQGGATGNPTGSNGNNSILLMGTGGAGTGGRDDGTAGAAGSKLGNTFAYTLTTFTISRRNIIIACGSGGGGGAHTGAGGAAGGAGGGAFIIECGGSLTFTGTIDISGLVGASGSAAGASGGGGGAAGMALIMYNSLKVNSGTITAVGGAGGEDGGYAAVHRTGGGGAGSYTFAGGNGGGNGAGGNAAVGTGAGGGGSGTNGASGGAAGATDTTAYLITQNLWLA